MREAFRSVGEGGLREDLLPVRLFHLAKRWFWDPAAIDFSQDAQDWQRCTPDQQDAILRLAAIFQAGEEAVTLDLLPLVHTIAREGRLEEEMFLTSFLFEEAKHVEFFRRFLNAIGATQDLHGYHTPSYKALFCEALPEAMNRLMHDPSPAAQIEAAVTYNIIVEGLLAETGYHAFGNILRDNGIMPGLCSGLQRTQTDESRHIAWGVYHCARLVATDPLLLPVLQTKAAGLSQIAMGIIQEIFAAYEVPPFGLAPDTLVAYAMNQYQRRMVAIERAVGQPLEQILRLDPTVIAP